MVKTVPSIDPAEFLAAVQPYFEKADIPGLLSLVDARWDSDQICSLLGCESADARKVALLVVGLAGETCCVEQVARHLRDPDPLINQLAEHALWTVWFRGGTSEANCELARGAQAMHRRRLPCAIYHFSRAIEFDPTFAEPFNQRALANYLLDNHHECVADCRRVVQLMPCHFGAWAGMGHSQAHLGRLNAAIRSYEQALAINPHLDCVREAVDELRRRTRQSAA